MASGMLLNAFADVARTYPFEELRQGTLGPDLVVKQPVGASAAIIPWNVGLWRHFVFVLLVAGWKGKER